MHGQAAAVEAQTAAEALFGGGGAGGSIPTTQISAAELAECPQLLDIMMKVGLTKSRGEGRRLITQGGVLLNGEKVTDEFASLSEADLADGGAMIKKGKKVFHKIVLK